MGLQIRSRKINPCYVATMIEGEFGGLVADPATKVKHRLATDMVVNSGTVLSRKDSALSMFVRAVPPG